LEPQGKFYMDLEPTKPPTWRAELVAELASRVAANLCSRRGSVFQVRGVDPTTKMLLRLGDALRKDLESGNQDMLRAELRSCMGALSDAPLSFRDLRMLATNLRSTLLTCIAEDPQLDATATRKAEDWCHELALQCGLLLVSWREEVIERQALALEAKLAEERQLSIPIAPVYEGVLVVPLVGSLDPYRSQILNERVLNEISATGSRFVLLDISGVPVFDQEVARHLLKITAATRLLGTELVLVGISPETTKVIITLEVDLRGLVTLRNLQDGLAYALKLLNRSIVSTTPSKPDKPTTPKLLAPSPSQSLK
jgi:anti-anti-sigma regulatory factor